MTGGAALLPPGDAAAEEGDAEIAGAVADLLDRVEECVTEEEQAGSTDRARPSARGAAVVEGPRGRLIR
jgi:hypothetical protein